MDAENPLRKLPQVQRLLETEEAGALINVHSHSAVAGAVREVLSALRTRIAGGERPPADLNSLMALTADVLVGRAKPGLRRVINATGIVLHTNLGRAPLAQEAIAAVGDVCRGYSNLELDLGTGGRGARAQAVEPLLREVTGSEAAVAVNNGAAAILLALSALAGGGEVIVSRGELVEIGGGFRVPDVIRQGGARLVEVGSTNKTRIADYRAAIGPETRVLLKVHQSNFRTIGFTAEAGIAELAELGREHGLPVIVDLGSGLLRPVPGVTEPTIAEALAAGAGLVTCSGDKLLGGPQAGLVLGQEALVAPLRKHPLMRALRLDKMALAALEATVRLHRDRPERIPVLRMLGQTERELAARAEVLRALVGQGSVEATEAYAGGGSLPEERIASRALCLDPPGGAQHAAATLRTGWPAVLGRIADGRLVIDMLAVSDDDLPELATALEVALG